MLRRRLLIGTGAGLLLPAAARAQPAQPARPPAGMVAIFPPALVGLWSSSPDPAGPGDVMRLWPNGRYVGEAARTDCENRHRRSDGAWQMDGPDRFRLRIGAALMLDGGTRSPAPGRCATGYDLSGARESWQRAATPMESRAQLTMLPPDPRSGRPAIALNFGNTEATARTYWRHDADPARGF